jgi:hypothetical protein
MKFTKKREKKTLGSTGFRKSSKFIPESCRKSTTDTVQIRNLVTGQEKRKKVAIHIYKQSGDDSNEDLAKFGYMLKMKVES